MVETIKLPFSETQLVAFVRRICDHQLPDWFLGLSLELQTHYLEWESKDLYEADYLGSLGTSHKDPELAQDKIRRHGFNRNVRKPKLATYNTSTPHPTKISPTTPGTTKLDDVVQSLKGKERATKLDDGVSSLKDKERATNLGHDIFSKSMYYKLCSISSDSLEALERMHWITPNDMKTSSSTKLGNSTTSPPSPPPNRTQFTTSSTQLTSSRLPPSAHRRPAPCAKPSGTPTQLALRPVIRRQPPGAQMVRLTPYRPAPATSRIFGPSYS